MNNFSSPPCSPHHRGGVSGPYAIISTNSALLTRSSYSTNNTLHDHSFSPPMIPNPSSPSSRRHEYRQHRHSKSLSSLSSPPSLPAPPSISTACGSNSASSSTSRNYQDDCGSDAADSESEGHAAYMQESVSIPPKYFDSSSLTLIKADPKKWTSVQLSDYLLSQKLEGLAKWALENHVTGAKMAAYHQTSGKVTTSADWAIDQSDSLFEQSRRLRLLSLKSRIWRIQRLSELDCESGDEEPALDSPISRGRVKGMVEALETRSRSSSVCSGSDMSSSPSVDNDTPQANRVASAEKEHRESIEELRDVSISASAHFSSSDDGLSEAATPLLLVDDVNPFIVTSPTSAGEPSIQDLLDQYHNAPLVEEAQGLAHSWGAKAWEEELGYSATAKRIIPQVTNAMLAEVADAESDVADAEFDIADAEPSFQQDWADVKPVAESNAAVATPARASPSPVNEGRKNTEDNKATTALDSQQVVDDKVRSSAEPDAAQELHDRIALLEAKLQDLQHQASTSGKQAPSAEVDLPQYLLMAGVGVCAIVGQAVLKKVFGSR